MPNQTSHLTLLYESLSKRVRFWSTRFGWSVPFVQFDLAVLVQFWFSFAKVLKLEERSRKIDWDSSLVVSFFFVASDWASISKSLGSSTVWISRSLCSVRGFFNSSADGKSAVETSAENRTCTSSIPVLFLDQWTQLRKSTEGSELSFAFDFEWRHLGN